MRYAVELQQVSKTFGTFTALDKVSLQIEEGKFFSLLGPSGCGKTTTLRLIAGFDLPSQGTIKIQGDEISALPAFKRPVNTVFQNYALFPHMTIAQNIAFGLEMQKIPKAEIKNRVIEALALVRLEDRAGHRPNQLSGGQQQRVALARALVNRPAVLLLDEPLGALDLKLRKQMQLELKQMQEQVGITFIYVTHDQEEALTMSDRIAVMSNGKVVQCATPRELYEEPRTRYVADFIGETNFLEGRLTSLNGVSEVLVDNRLPISAAACEPSISLGSQVTVAIRPEQIRLFPFSHNQMSNANEFDHLVCASGTVREAIYIGTDTRYLVQLTDNVQVVARVQNYGQKHDATPERGDQVIVSWSASNARVLVD